MSRKKKIIRSELPSLSKTMADGFIMCSKCNDAQFQEYVNEKQQFPYKSCRSCRDKVKVEREASGQPGLYDKKPQEDIGERLTKMGEYLEDRFNRIEELIKNQQGLNEMNKDVNITDSSINHQK